MGAQALAECAAPTGSPSARTTAVASDALSRNGTSRPLTRLRRSRCENRSRRSRSARQSGQLDQRVAHVRSDCDVGAGGQVGSGDRSTAEQMRHALTPVSRHAAPCPPRVRPCPRGPVAPLARAGRPAPGIDGRARTCRRRPTHIYQQRRLAQAEALAEFAAFHAVARAWRSAQVRGARLRRVPHQKARPDRVRRYGKGCRDRHAVSQPARPAATGTPSRRLACPGQPNPSRNRA